MTVSDLLGCLWPSWSGRAASIPLAVARWRSLVPIVVLRVCAVQRSSLSLFVAKSHARTTSTPPDRVRVDGNSGPCTAAH